MKAEGRSGRKQRSNAANLVFRSGAWTVVGGVTVICLLQLSSFNLHPFLQSLALTLRLSLTTTLLLLALGIPLAHWLNTSRWRGAALVQTLVALPMVLPPTVIGFYLLVCYAPDHLPGSLWLRLTGRALSFSFTGLVIGSILYSLPYAVQPFQAALRAVPVTMLEAAVATGAAPWRTFWRVHLPLARRGVLVGATLSFAHTVGEFGVVLMLGGSIPGETKVASIALYDEVQKFNYPLAHAYAATLLVVSGVLLSAVTFLQRDAPE